MKKMRYRDFNIIDVHAHITEHIAGFGYRGELRAIGGGRGRYVTGEEVTILPEGFGDTSFTHDQLIGLMNAYGVSKAILMQGSFIGFCNEYGFEAQERHRGRLYGMGTFDPYCTDYIRIMKRLINDFHFRGFKFEMSTAFGFMGYHPDFKLDGERMRTVFDFAEDYGLVISLDMGTFGEESLQLKELAGIAGRHSGINFVVEHIFYPHRDHYGDVKAALEQLGGHENISFTTASIQNSTMPEKYPFPLACRYLEIAKEIVGAKRLMWGSDLPGVIVNAPYDELINYCAESGIFAREELADIYANNARRIYQLQD